jgi:hypothetical protein
MSIYQPMIQQAAEHMKALNSADHKVAAWVKKLDFMAYRVPTDWADDAEMAGACSDMFTESVMYLHETPGLPAEVQRASKILCDLMNEIKNKPV